MRLLTTMVAVTLACACGGEEDEASSSDEKAEAPEKEPDEGGGEDEGADETGGGSEAAALQKLADKMCACADADCANTTMDEFVAYVAKLKKDNTKGSNENIEAAGKAAEKTVMCFQKAGGDSQKLMDLSNAVQ